MFRKKKNQQPDLVKGFCAEAYPAGNWVICKEPKVSYIERKQTHGFHRIIMTVMKYAAHADDTINVFKVLAHLRSVLTPYTMFFVTLYQKNALGLADTETVVLRAAWRLGCIYEYSQHRPFLKKMGYSDARLDSFAEENCDSWTDKERMLFVCTDDLIRDHKVSDEHMTLMKQFYDDDQAVQYLMLVGHYVMVAGLVNSAGVTMEDKTWLQPSK